MTAPPHIWTRLARRLGRGSNPLRRREDLLDAWLTPVTIVVFLAMCPLIVGVTGALVRSVNSAAERAQSSWRPVPAVLLHSAPGAAGQAYGAIPWESPTLARWTAGGRARTGEIPAPAGARAGSTVTAWLNRDGRVEAPPLTKREAGQRVVELTLSALSLLAAVLITMMQLARHALNRRRLASWEAAWLAIGPLWSRRG